MVFKMDMTSRLNDIICKYDIDSGFPEYKKYCKALKLINNFFDKFTSQQPVMLVAYRQIDLDIIRSHVKSNIVFDTMLVDFMNMPTFDVSKFQSHQCVVLVSYTGRREVSHALNQAHISHEFIYDYFLENDLNIQHEYYDYLQSVYFGADDGIVPDFYYHSAYREIFFEKKVYESSETEILRAFYLKRIIFMLLDIKDFLYAKKYVDEYVKYKYTNYEKLLLAWNDIDKMLADIKNKLSQKSSLNTIMFWLDALSFGEVEDMPFLNNVESVNFTRAYSSSPFTAYTFANILTGKKTVDDDGWKYYSNIPIEDAVFIRELENNGISFVCCKYAPNKLPDMYYTKELTYPLKPTTEYFWAAVTEFLDRDEPLFILTHEMQQTHPPCVSIANDGKDIFWSRRPFPDMENELLKNQRIESTKYADDQLKFYSNLIPENINKIFMSDHGTQAPNDIRRYHVLLKIQAPDLKPEIVDDLFSYLDFHKLISWLYNREEIVLNSVFRSYVEIQDVDFHSPRVIKTLFKNPSVMSADNLLGFRAVVTHEEFYMCRNDGMETFYWTRPANTPIAIGRLNELRKLCGDYVISSDNNDFFKFSRYSYKAIERYLQRTHIQRELQLKSVREAFSLLRGKNVAIRTGGYQACKLLRILCPDLIDTVKFVIDINKNCQASYYGMNIITPDEMQAHSIDLVIIPVLPKINNKLYRTLNVELKTVGSPPTTMITDYIYDIKHKIQIQQLFAQFEGKTVAVRTGGIGTVDMFNVISPDALNRIRYIVDRNESCLACDFGIDVITPERANELQIDVYIVPCYDDNIIAEIKNELSNSSSQIIYLKDCAGNYDYIDLEYYSFKQEDLVDFPF